MLSLFREQPPAFRMIFMLEIWERFGFYTVQGIITLYFMRFLGFSDAQAFYTFGAFSALVYGLIAFGGYLGDRVLGTKRTIVLGLITLALGYLALTFADRDQVYFALALICVGNGLFKANPSSLLSKCYTTNDPRLHGGFTLYYMAINIGSIVALIAGPEVAKRFGYSYAYFASVLGLVFGLINYWAQKKYIENVNNQADLNVITIWQWSIVIVGIICSTLASAYLLQHVFVAEKLVWLLTIVIVVVYCLYMRQQQRASFLRMFVALILMVEAIVFFTLYQQMPTSLNLFAVNNVTPTLLGITFDPQSFQALNAIWIVVLSPFLAAFYGWLDRQGVVFTVAYKFAAGMFFCGFSFCILFFARYFSSAGMVSSWWLVASYFFQSIGELLVSALGVAMVAELVPAGISGFVMGMWFLTSSVAGFIGATVASYTALPAHITPGAESLVIYTQVFAYIGLVTLAIGLLMWFLAARLNRYITSYVNTDFKMDLDGTLNSLSV